MTIVQPTPPSVERRIEGRERIVQEARPLFVARGFNAVSMQQIADAAGVNKATLYHHFRDKEELFLDVVRGEIARATATMMGAVNAGGDFRTRLYRMVSAFFATTELDYFRLIADLHEYVSEERRVRLLEETPPPWKAIRPVIEDAIAAGEIRPIPVDLAVSMLFHAIFGQIKLEKMSMLAYSADDALATLLVDLLLDGLAAPN